MSLTITPPAGRVYVPGAITLTSAQQHAIGGVAIELIRRRVADFRGLNDSAMKPYSPHGPIYKPVFGVGTLTKHVAGKTVTLKRTKANLGGAAGFTTKDFKAVHKGARKGSALAAFVTVGRGAKSSVASRTRSGKSIAFKNYAAYKRALGKSGNRDLEESGRMLNSITIADSGPDHITLGFSREEEQQKALGNQAIAPWFGLSPRDVDKLTPFVAEQIKAAIIDSMVGITL